MHLAGAGTRKESLEIQKTQLKSIGTSLVLDILVIEVINLKNNHVCWVGKETQFGHM